MNRGAGTGLIVFAVVFGVVLGVVGAIINSLPSGPDPGYRGENPEEAGRSWNYL
jgi:hypothetical protein